jgi:hypothetical protein
MRSRDSGVFFILTGMTNSISAIALVNQSSLAADDLVKYAAAQSKQIQQDLEPVWKRFATIYYAPDPSKIPAEDWIITIYDQPQTQQDQGALGYHTIDSNGRPYGKVFQQYSVQDGSTWTSVLSHEVLETLGDEWANEVVERGMPDNSLQLWPRELCDAVQGQSYEIDGVVLSNFVWPGYFIDGYTGKMDQLGLVTSPFQVTSGGYSALVLISADGGIQQQNVYGPDHPAWRIQQKPSARMKRRSLLGRYPSVDVILPKA